MGFVVIVAIVFAVLLSKLHDRIRMLERTVDALQARLDGTAPLPEPAAAPRPEPEPIAPEPVRRPATIKSASTPASWQVDAPLPTEAEPEREPEPALPLAEPTPAFNLAATFENLVGGKLPIWIGGAALILSAFFLVRYSIESGLLGPGVRSILGALFGVALLGASELARRHRATADDPRVGQALAGAGIASLYGTLYMAAELYGLVAALPAFLFMVAITVSALALSLRHGPPTAVMGLVGGFAAPLVTGLDASNIAPLLVYLALFTAGLFALAIHRGWMWLALAATGGGFVWPLILMGLTDGTELPWVGMFVLALAFTATLALPRAGTPRPWLRLAPLLVGLVQLVLIAPQLEFSALAWGFYTLLAAAALWLGWRDDRLAPGAGAALGLALTLLVIALIGGDKANAPVAALVFTLLFGGAGHALMGRTQSDRIWTGVALAGTAAPLLLTNLLQPDLLRPAYWALLGLGAAIPCEWASWRSRGRAVPEVRLDFGLTGGAAAAALLVGAGVAQPIAPIWLGALFLTIGVSLAGWARRCGDGSLFQLSIVPVAAAALASTAAIGPLFDYLESVLGGGSIPPLETLAAIGILPAVLLALHCWLLGAHAARAVFHWAAWLLALSIPLALVPAPWHAPLLALIAAAALASPARRVLPHGGEIAALAATALAMVPQLLPMAATLLSSLAGDTTPFTHLPPIAALLREVGLPAAILAATVWFRPESIEARLRLPVAGMLAITITATLYALAKQPLAIATPERFLALGFLERAVLTQLLFALGWLAIARFPRLRIAGYGVYALAALRILWFDLLLLNPVAVAHHVGPLPLANLAVAHTALAALWFWLASRQGLAPRLLRGAALVMTMVAMLTAIRQLIHGTLLTAPGITITENYLYSAGLLVLALLWLWRGIAAGIGDLRIVGLALLTLVTFKVFLVDAGALAGVLRILSFLGLGLALIGIGWAYGRFLGTGARKPETSG